MWAQLSSAAAAVSSEISPLDPEMDQGIRAALRFLGIQHLHGRPSCLAALYRPRELPKYIAAGDACPANQAFRTQAPVCLFEIAHASAWCAAPAGASRRRSAPSRHPAWCATPAHARTVLPVVRQCAAVSILMTLVHQTCPASKHQRPQSQSTPCLLMLLRPVLSSICLTSETRCSTVGKPGLPYASSGG